MEMKSLSMAETAQRGRAEVRGDMTESDMRIGMEDVSLNLEEARKRLDSINEELAREQARYDANFAKMEGTMEKFRDQGLSREAIDLAQERADQDLMEQKKTINVLMADKEKLEAQLKM